MATSNDRLKQIRLALGLTQKEFADSIKVKQSYYSEVENEKRPVTGRLATKLVDTHGVSADFLLSGKAEMFTDPDHLKKWGGKHDSITNKSLNSDKKAWGQANGGDMGFEEKKYQLQQAAKRFFEDLKTENPELSKLFDDAFNVIDFQFFIKHLTAKYLSKIILLEDGKDNYFNNSLFNYSEYKADHIKAIEKIKNLGPALHNLSSAIMQFYSEFAPFDKENIISEHFPGIKGQ